MKDALFLLVIDVAYICNALIMWVLAWYLTEKAPRQIPVKPFNCRPCLTFWLTFLGCAGVTFMAPELLPSANNYWAVVIVLLPLALMIALISFLIVKFNYTVYE